MGTSQVVWDVIAPHLLIEWLLLEQEGTKLYESQPLEVDLTEFNLSNKPDVLKLKTKTNHHLQCWRCWSHQADIIWFSDLLAVSDLLLDKSLSPQMVKISKPNLISPKLIFPWLQYNKEKKVKTKPGEAWEPGCLSMFPEY